jgi:hypothetical protein
MSILSRQISKSLSPMYLADEYRLLPYAPELLSTRHIPPEESMKRSIHTHYLFRIQILQMIMQRSPSVVASISTHLTGDRESVKQDSRVPSMCIPIEISRSEHLVVMPPLRIEERRSVEQSQFVRVCTSYLLHQSVCPPSFAFVVNHIVGENECRYRYLDSRGA